MYYYLIAFVISSKGVIFIEGCEEEAWDLIVLVLKEASIGILQEKYLVIHCT